MQPAEDRAEKLAVKLRSLRVNGLNRKITQVDLAKALGCSPALISSWENATAVPPAEHLGDYARFFATVRSIERAPYRLLSDDELNDDETARRDELLGQLRAAAPAGEAAAAISWAGPPTLVGQGPWHFPDAEPGSSVVIVCPELPPEVLTRMPHADPTGLDYSEMSRLSDLDALFNLLGHIRAVNPDLEVVARSVKSLRRDESTAHLVVLGGVDWNPTSRDVMRRVDAPVSQLSENDPLYRGCFQVVSDQTKSFAPVIERVEGKPILLEDVGYFFRGPNPYNLGRTVTLCNGMFSSGVLGAVRTLTDRKFRDKNADYLRREFGDQDSYSILFRVPVIAERVVVTPDWTAPHSVLHTWSE